MAERLARRFCRYDPDQVRKVEPVYGVVEDAIPGGLFTNPQPARHGITHFRTTESTRDEQTYFKSLDFMELRPGQFLLGRGSREGELPTTLEKITITQVDPGLYADAALAARIRAKLTARHGVLEADVLAEIAERTGQCPCLRRPVFHDLVHGHPADTTHPPSAQTARDGASSSTHPARDGTPSYATASPQQPRRSPVPSGTGRSAEPSGTGRSARTSPPSETRRAQPAGRGKARAPGAEPDMVRAGIDRRPGR